ncbi:unnamed protein product [Coccothraustes coccothraustes]
MGMVRLPPPPPPLRSLLAGWGRQGAPAAQFAFALSSARVPGPIHGVWGPGTERKGRVPPASFVKLLLGGKSNDREGNLDHKDLNRFRHPTSNRLPSRHRWDTAAATAANCGQQACEAPGGAPGLIVK